MKLFDRLMRLAIFGLALLAYGCAATPPPQPKPRPLPEPSDAEIVKVRVVVAPEISKKIAAGARIVITNFYGPCKLEVQDALMRRLVDNADYDVLTRDHLEQILSESEKSWTGDFDSTTATRLGDLLGASLFVVGRIAYCGPSQEQVENQQGTSYSILAVLQILDLRTGKVLVSSAGEGVYTPKSARLLIAEETTEFAVEEPEVSDLTMEESVAESDEAQEVGPAMDVETDSWFARQYGKFKNMTKKLGEKARQGTIRDSWSPSGDESDKRDRPVNLVAFKAAEDLANRFADKFFARPAWEDVDMWTSPEWAYGDSIHFVKLGHCQEAVDFLQGPASHELATMSDLDVARYLHNLGVAFLCNNEIESAMKKLRSAYRLTYDPATLEMLELAAKIVEWSLTVEVDKEKEVDMLVERAVAAR